MSPSNWFTEQHEASGSSIGYRVGAKLADEKTPFQHIEVWRTTDWGNLMVIDGCIMLTSRDNFFYHEMISHPALFTHAAPKDVVPARAGTAATGSPWWRLRRLPAPRRASAWSPQRLRE